MEIIIIISSSSSSLSSSQVRSLAPSRYAGYPALLIAVGCFVFALSVAAIIYLLMVYARSEHLISEWVLKDILSTYDWDSKDIHDNCIRYRHSKDRAQRMVVIPRYEPVFVEPNMKQYEVQVSN